MSTDFWQAPQQRAGRLRVGSAYSNHCGGDVRRASRADRRRKIVTDCSGEGSRASDWGLQQFGIRAVIAPSFAELFYSNAMNNRLLLVALAEDQIAVLMKAADDPTTSSVRIDVGTMTVTCCDLTAPFTLSPRHRRMFPEGLDVIGLTLTYRDRIGAFSEARWARQPWVRDVASRTAKRLGSA